ncbi:MAG: insulinase family protein [Rickettsiales bacterium]|nr:insulinase family protein [Rickettsiales bacterium]
MKKTKIGIPLFLLSLLVIPLILKLVDKQINQYDIAELDVEFLQINDRVDVIFIPNHKVPAILNMIWFKVGGIDEPKNKTGIAHFFEHIIFHNTDNHKKGEYDKFLESIGGSNNAFTSFDYTSYFATFPKDYYEQVLDFEFDRLNNLQFDPELIETERKIILEERLLRKDNDPGQELMIESKQILFSKDNLYSRPLIGYLEDINNITVDDLIRFQATQYNSKKMFMVVSGDISKEQLMEVLTRKFNQYFPEEASEAELSTPLASPQHNKEIKTKTIIKQTHKTSSYNINWIYRIDNFYDYQQKDRFALILLDHILSGLPNSLMPQNFIIKDHLAQKASTSYSNLSRAGANHFSLEFSLSDKENFVPLNNKIKLLLQNLKLGRFDHDLFKTAKANLLSRSIYEKESFKSLGFNIGGGYASGLRQEDIINWDQNIADVKYRDVIEIANKIFTNENLLKAYLIPEDTNDFKEMIYEQDNL